MSNKLLFLIFLFIIATNSSKADQGDLEKLYRAVSKELNVGTYEDFKAKMETVDERRRFYDKVDQLGYDLGSYEAYEQRLKSVGSNQYSKRDSVRLLRESVYKDMDFGSQGISYDKFLETMSNNEKARLSVYSDLGLEGHGISYEQFLNKMGLDYKRQLWEDLNKDGFYTKSFEEFKSLMSNHNARRIFYDQAIDQGYELGSYEVYERRIRGGMIFLVDPRKKMYDVLVAPDINLYSGDYESFLKKYSTPQQIEELFVILSSQELYTRSFDSFKVQYFPEYFPEQLKQILKDYVETANSGKYPNSDELHKQFPEFQNFDKQVLRDYVAAANSGKYSSLDEVNTEFPELFPYLEVDVKDSEVKQKDLSSKINWQILTWIVIGLISMVLIWYLFKTGIIKKTSSYLSNVFYLFAVWFKKNKKRIGVSVAVILTIAIITNPSVNTFKSFLRSKGYPKTKIEHLAGRYANFYIFSIYKYEGESYLGLFGNFVKKNKLRGED